MATEKFANHPTPSSPSTAWATITAAINASETGLAFSTLAPFPTAVQFRILIGDELMLVTALPGGLAATVTRGIEGTTAAAHSSGASVYHVLSAAALARSPRSMTTLGDIEYLDSNGSPARLGVGTVGHVLTVAGGLPSWASPISLATDTQVLFNNAGAFGGFGVWDGTTLDLGVGKRVRVSGHVGFGGAGTIDGPDVFEDVSVQVVSIAETIANAVPGVSGLVNGGSVVLTISPDGSVDYSTKEFDGWDIGLISTGDAANQSIGYLQAMNIVVDRQGDADGRNNGGVSLSIHNSGNGEISDGLYGHFVDIHNAGAGNVNIMRGWFGFMRNTGTATIADAAFMKVDAPINSGGGTFTSYTHVELADLSAVANLTTAFAINYGAGKFSVDKDGKVDASAYKVGAVAGVSFGPAAVASITVVNGIVTAIS